ncbi:MAG: alpha-glucan phosphorylase, partial [Anaerolineae bacterium]|nr:alpha-glucan phosphorylase [Anaerolineae bacterium]
KVDETIEVSATVNLGELTPDSVRVELYYGTLNLRGEINDVTSEAVEMKPNGKSEGSVYTFSAQIKSLASGDKGISVRVLPKHDLLTTPFQPNLITWA